MQITKFIDEQQSSVMSLSEDDNAEISRSGVNLESLDVTKSLIEVAKVMQKIANMACMQEAEMNVCGS